MGWCKNAMLAMLPGLVAAGSLTQRATNGKSVLGTVDSPFFPPFLTNNPMPHGFPWGGLTANGTNQYTTHPNTGVIRSYDFVISRGVLAPDGYEKEMMLINGAFPGPTIEANWGDTIQVTVTNNITEPEEGTALHWHGFLQQGTPWEDGVPAITQCPIAPGSTFTYQFQATLYGTAWYHSHYSGQYGDGIVGPMVVHGPTEYDYDVDVGPIMLSDWYHKDYLTLVAEMLAPHGHPEVPSDNNLIQGKNNFDCATAEDKTVPCFSDADLAEFTFEAGKTHRLRLINAGAEGIQHFSIDGHNMTVIAYDFIPIEAYTTDVITLGVGQRADVLVTADAVTGPAADGAAFWMRSTIGCSTAKQPLAKAAIYYTTSDDRTNAKRAATTPAGVSATADAKFGASGKGWSVGAGGGAGGSWNPKTSPASKPSSPSSPSKPPSTPYGAPHGGSSTWGPPGSAGSHAPPSSPSGSNWPQGPGYGSTHAGYGASGRPLPTTQPWGSLLGFAENACTNDDLHRTTPLYPIALPEPSWTHNFDIGLMVNESDVTLWTFDGVSFRGDYNAPTLLLSSLGNDSWPEQWNARNLYTNSSVRMIVNNDSPSQHPMHLHGANFYVLHEGPGRWDGVSIINPENPMRRDVQLVRPGGHLVLQFDTTNPGVWPFHCHIAWHASGGFFLQFIVQPDEIPKMQVPSIMAQTCRDWSAWTGENIVEQIDSGL